jgi:hypothetical protein
MLSKITSKNQITLPKAIMALVPKAEYFEVEAVNNCIILTPVKVTRINQVWDKLDSLGITEQDITDAVEWSRHHPIDIPKTELKEVPKAAL